ncbi:uncharacterized protein [Epargyreus clarus]|uniref:uncharacterized protein n=1 Tax=Epargyreus clarus TaxID=520877 RepID=UPI003C2BCA0D
MEENVALDATKQKQFVKSIKGIKKLLKGKDPSGILKKKERNVKIGKVRKPRQKKRGLVYLSHIPHGFYEHQMTEYFKQFGVVTNARVIRSKHTGMSKGHAFVEFRDPNVAEIVAETMNNYLMGKRLIKAAVVPLEKQKRLAKRKHWNAQKNPGNDLRQKMKKAHNAVKDENEELKNARRLLSNLNKTKRKLRELDVDYDFFTPVDIPEPLLNLVEVKKEEDVKTETDLIKKEKKPNKVKAEEIAQDEKKSKKNKKKKSTEIEVKDEESKLPKQMEIPANKKSKTQQKSKETNQSNEKSNLKASNTGTEKVAKVDKNVTKQTKDLDKVTKDNAKVSKIQEQKQQKFKDAGVKPPEDFIQIQKDSGDESDSSVDFDSDEYEKAIEQDSDVQSNDESDETDEDLDEDITSEEDESAEDEPPTPPKKAKGPKPQIVSVTQSKKQGQKPNANKPATQPIKKINPKEAIKGTKKPKFEKKANKKTLNKVIKKKK